MLAFGHKPSWFVCILNDLPVSQGPQRQARRINSFLVRLRFLIVTNLAPTKLSTYLKVANFPGLHRHSRSGRYYGCKKLGGVRRGKSLETCDRKIVERRLKEWVGNMDKVELMVKPPVLAIRLDRAAAAFLALFS